jgi:hypothetical protein
MVHMTGTRPPAEESQEDLLDEAGCEHPLPAVIPSSRFGQRPSQPVEYVQVEPTVVVEVDVDTSCEQQRWRHAFRFVRLRSDLRRADLGPLVDP